LSIQELSTRLKDEVWALAKTVNHDQRPTYYDGILGRFCLPGCAAKAEKESEGMKENLTTTVVRPHSPKETIDKVKEDSPPAPQSSERPQQLAMKQPAPLPQVQPTEKFPSSITGKDGAPMVLVLAGEFMIGDDRSGPNDERPAHSVYLDAFYIDQYEVTTARYARHFKQTNRAAPQYWSTQVLLNHGNKPVVGVDWNDAVAYCSWAGKRLPTEAEWEKAARGTDQRVYPWGNEAPNEQRANFNDCCDFKDYGALTNVGSFEKGKSPYGVYDMAGNVWELVADWYDANHYSKSPKQNPRGPSSGDNRVLRGGSWSTEPGDVRSTNRIGGTPTNRDVNFGFRCAQDLPK
jgi:formylglycine-generating enzyme required for sulfatase activity